MRQARRSLEDLSSAFESLHTDAADAESAKTP